jgi:tetratricopeptide (TPR) repeat protein
MEGAKTHTAYAEALAAVGRFEDAAFEFQSSVLTSSSAEELAAAHLAYARFARARGQNDKAAEHRERARVLDPDHADLKSQP